MTPLISVNLQMASNITPGLLSCSIEYQFRQTALAALILKQNRNLQLLHSTETSPGEVTKTPSVIDRTIILLGKE